MPSTMPFATTDGKLCAGVISALSGSSSMRPPEPVTLWIRVGQSRP